MEKNEVKEMAAEIEREDSLFVDKSQLDTLVYPSNVIGRDDKVAEILRILMQYKKGFVPPFVSIYGRSGSGKSTIVKLICQSLDNEIKYRFVNLRQAKTVFGCANLILGELDHSQLQSAKGLNVAIAKISEAIAEIIMVEKKSDQKEEAKKLFVLVLDEFDALSLDKRSNISDFLYKLVTMEEKLREEGYLVCIIAISNNVTADYNGIDDRVKSRIGSAAVLFEPYSESEIQKILKDRASKALSVDIDPLMMFYLADKSSLEYGDARRALDLLRISAEIAESRHEKKITKSHVDEASAKLQEDRIGSALSAASYHLKLVGFALAEITYLIGKSWHFTSTLYEEYRKNEHMGVKLLGYRRVSELLVDLENCGIAESKKSLNGRHGNGVQYRLTYPAELVGKACFPELWQDEVESMKKEDRIENYEDDFKDEEVD